jgi:hypothetical protein
VSLGADYELVAGEAGHGVTGATQSRQTTRGLAEHVVAGVVDGQPKSDGDVGHHGRPGGAGHRNRCLQDH